MPDQPLEFRLSNEKRDQLFVEIGKMLKQKVVLQQTLREQKEQASSFSEDIFLELLEVVDALQFLLDYTAENSNPSTEFISNIPNSLAAVQKKFLSILAKRQLHQLEITGTKPDFNICKVIDCEVRNDLEESTITKVVRRGFRFGDKVIRPIEVITSKKELAAEVPSAVSREEIIQDATEIDINNLSAEFPEEATQDTTEIDINNLSAEFPEEATQDTTEVANQDLSIVSSGEVIPESLEINNDNLLKSSTEEVTQDTTEVVNQDLSAVSSGEVIQKSLEINTEDLTELSAESIIQEIQELANQDLSLVSSEEVIAESLEINTENLSELSAESIIQEIQELEEIAQAIPEIGEDSQISNEQE